MNSRRTATSAVRDSVTAIYRKLFKQQKDSVRDQLLSDLISGLRKRTEKEGGLDAPSVICKARIAELVLPDILSLDAEGKVEIDHSKAKTWAFACGEMIGMLAGLSIQESKMSGAIDQVADEAKATAQHIHNGITRLSGSPSKREDAPPPQKQSKSSANAERTRMITDLETQALLETDAAAKAALQSMADRLKKEASLEDAA